MQTEIKFGSVSWINESPNPITFAAASLVLNPAWVPKTYVGLVATANDKPPTTISDFGKFRGDKDFRALTFCHVGVIVDDATGAVTKSALINSFTDPGFTPPFSFKKYPSASLGSAADGWTAFKATWSFAHFAGELSSVSSVVTGRHKNTTIATVPGGGTVIASTLVKFRAGTHTDSLGVDVVGCPYHVPWVWCETLLVYVGGRFKLVGRGSIFPTHTWYLDGAEVMSQTQVADASFPKIPLPGARAGAFGPLSARAVNPFQINVPALALYPVLSAGAPASGAQTPLSAEAALGGAVDSQPNAVSGGSIVTHP